MEFPPARTYPWDATGDTTRTTYGRVNPGDETAALAYLENL
ncbi:hypothetical protein [Corynebacterium pyruviciproducens]|nr:hypothetical protein [Corynebacterium pyruviciproducens]